MVRPFFCIFSHNFFNMKNSLYSIAILLTMAACKPVMQVAHIEKSRNTNITDSFASDPKIQAFILPYKTDLEKKMNIQISYSPIELSKAGTNSHLGNLLADYLYEAGNQWLMTQHNTTAHGAVMNIGGIRNSIGQGKILVRDIYEVMPFENEVVIVKFKGKAIESLFEYYEKSQKNNPVSGLNIEVVEGKLTQALIKGKRVDSTQDYYIVTSDYLALGGDNMGFFSQGESIMTGMKLRDVFIEKFKQNNPLHLNQVEQRLIFKKNTQ